MEWGKNDETQVRFVFNTCMCVWMVILTHIMEDLQNPGLGTRVTKFKKIEPSRQAQII